MKKFITKALIALGLIGNVGYVGSLTVRNPKTGEIILHMPNLIVNKGLDMAAYQLGNGSKPLNAACVGEGTTAPTNGDTALESQVDTQTPVFSQVTTSVTNDTAQFVSLHTAGVGGWAITEYGIKYSTTDLFNRVTFTAINLAENDELEFTYKVQCQRSA